MGKTTTASSWALQQLDQAPFVNAAGARHIQVSSAQRALFDIQLAFHVAATEHLPVVLTVPIDLQRKPAGDLPQYVPSRALRIDAAPPSPTNDEIAGIAALIDAATRPIFITGRGSIAAGGDVASLAAKCGALLATTLPARGLFDDDPYSLGIAGGFSTELAQSQFAASDLVVAFGASLGHHTTDGGKLFPKARVVQVDIEPRGMWQGLKVADRQLRADAGEAAKALLGRVADKVGARDTATAERIRTYPGDTHAFPDEPGTIDPRVLMAELDRIVPKDWTIIASTGHCFYFSAALTRGRGPENFHTILDFGAIGSNLAYAIGIAASQGDGKIGVFDGDGSFLMQVQELETIRRHRLRLLVCVMNDGAYGAELHKLEVEGIDVGETIFGRPALAAVAQAFGLSGETVTDPAQLPALFDAHLAAGAAEVWDVHVSRNVVSPYYRHEHWNKAH